MSGNTTVRLALAQINPVVGAIASNRTAILRSARQAAKAGATIVAFGEMALTGYPVEDLVYRDSFVKASRAGLEFLAQQLATQGLGQLVVVVGYLDADGPLARDSNSRNKGGPRNAAALLYGGRVITTYYKHHLPNYGVFDEDRYFISGNRLPVVRLGLPPSFASEDEEPGGREIDIAMVICEDMWASNGPVTAAGEADVGLIISLNGSPYEVSKDDARLKLCQRRARKAGANLAYINLVGGQDDLVYDGDSLVVDSSGQLLARAEQFNEDLLVVDVEVPLASSNLDGRLVGLTVERLRLDLPAAVPPVEAAPARITEPMQDEAEIWAALVHGTRDYVRKNGFASVVLGLSGGIDSSVCAAVAVDAIGGDHVVGISMPSQYSSEHSRTDADELAKRLELDYRVVPIAKLVTAFTDELGFTGLAEENLQARVRGLILMGLSNAEGHLVLTTGNKSELAVGYSTLYGDSVGGFNPIKDVLKTWVWRIARWRNEDARSRGETPPIPDSVIEKPPSAELAPNQFDTDSLPPYEQLDAILNGYVDGDLDRDELLAYGHDETIVDRVVRMVDRAEYKRRQSAPGPKISPKAFGRDRRLPITSGWREHG